MSISFLTNLTEQEFKQFLKEAIKEVLSEENFAPKTNTPDILDVKQAAAFLKMQVATLYEKTSYKLVPHFKLGKRLYFYRFHY